MENAGSENQEPDSAGKKKFLRVVRVLWNLFTLPFTLVGVIIGSILGFFKGLISALLHRKWVLLGIRSGALAGVITGVKLIFGTSSKVFSFIFGGVVLRRLEDDFPDPDPNFMIFGHRGSPGAKPENTLESFRQALREHANGVEIDLCLTKDGQVIVWHDWDPDSTVALFREAGQENFQKYRPFPPTNEFRRPIPELTLEEVRQHFGYAEKDGNPLPNRRVRATIPTFREFVEWTLKKKELKFVLLDIKVPEDKNGWPEIFANQVMKTLLELQPTFTAIWTTAYEPVFLKMSKLVPAAQWSFDIEIVGAMPLSTNPDPTQFSSMIPAAKYNNSYCSVGRPTFLTLAAWEIYQEVVEFDLRYRKEYNLCTQLIAWTINDKSEQKSLVRMGVDGILTDRPAALFSVVIGTQGRHIVRSSSQMLPHIRLRSKQKPVK